MIGDLLPLHRALVLLEGTEVLDDGVVHRSPRRLTRIPRGQEPAERFHPSPFLGQDHVVLGREVPEEGALGDLRCVGDLLDGDVVVALRREEPERGVFDLARGSLATALPQRRTVEAPLLHVTSIRDGRCATSHVAHCCGRPLPPFTGQSVQGFSGGTTPPANVVDHGTSTAEADSSKNLGLAGNSPYA